MALKKREQKVIIFGWIQDIFVLASILETLAEWTFAIKSGNLFFFPAIFEL